MNSKKSVFVTGGAGFIGSHTVIELLQAGYEVIVIDNFVNAVLGQKGEAPSLQRAEQITGEKITFYECDLMDKARLSSIFSQHKIDFVIHFAAVKAVGESMQKPLFYYKNNVVSTIYLLEVMKEYGVYNMVFSSSCVVYGNPQYLPIDEAHPTGNVTNVYGRTKYAVEQMLEDICRAEKQWNIISLRYFNPVGAHPSGLVGEDPTRPFTNLMPFIGQVATGKKDELVIYGSDYDTVDGTGVRDFIHVMDLATGHVAALKKLEKNSRYKVYNLGTGQGVTVAQLVECFEKVSGKKVPFRLADRRRGDIPAIWGDNGLAEKELGWKAEYGLKEMCEDYWRWQTLNPEGYRSKPHNGN
ncbi:UDP-glucose 4-epimerase isoform X2 [Parasteatoda tepidariorum]|nr:UDP-glucose 4-epimerase isoform X2 [Parasteatoda tepidariorum]XP_042901513.1 UDP-glucose 4-epimerase isoform X2 [Parasteatoda tepidariorum]XP_042901519.1 UDP-glucose 4-epimerase isoform X2 [Parasteatoda tepidariorum]XP_042901521.1 UDP-glucose 4-epimerase isoform X2 [Parasteatoda tepidariorum]